MAIADTFGRLKIVNSMIGTAWQALVHLLVDDVALVPFPAGLTVALATYTGAVIRACGVFAVPFVTSFALPSGLALAAAPYALTVSGTVCNATVRFRNVAFRTFPAFLAVAQAASVLTVSRA